jgi:hypothetical protein
MPQNTRRTGFRGPSPDVGRTTQFKPGESGNPGGRPRVAYFRRALETILTEGGEPAQRLIDLVEAQERKARRGDTRAAEFLRDTLDGKPVAAEEPEQARIEITIGGLPESVEKIIEARRNRVTANTTADGDSSAGSAAGVELSRSRNAESSIELSNTKQIQPSAPAPTPDQRLRQRYPWLD